MLPTVAKYLTRPCEVLPALLTPLFSRTHYTTTKNLLDFSSLRTKVYGAISAVYFGVAIQRHCHYKSVTSVCIVSPQRRQYSGLPRLPTPLLWFTNM